MYQDIGVGLLIAVISCIIASPENGWILIAFGAISAVIPDIDYLFYMQKTGWKINRYTYLHRDLFHYPVLFLLIGLAIYYVNVLFGVVWLLCVIAHFVHDTYTAWGIRWLFPFWRSYLVLRSDSPKKVVSTKKELREIVDVYGDDNWLQNEYKEKSFSLFMEKIIFLAGIMATLLYAIR